MNKEIEARNKPKETAAETGNVDDFNEYKRKRNDVSMKMKTAEKEYHENKLSDENTSTKTVLQAAY